MNLADLVFDRWEWQNIIATEMTTLDDAVEDGHRTGEIQASHEVQDEYFVVRMTVEAEVYPWASYFLQLTGYWQSGEPELLNQLSEEEGIELSVQAVHQEAAAVINEELEHLGNRLVAPFPQFEADMTEGE